ncbi:hypothetical protein VPH49_25820 [Pseudomonas luteola]|uniref:hypothetical protein n=1 Tax=Pseudomonas luteola TaxID=47886 RepID=UPI001239EC93|nr:hypothetical protein [Pseudomonas luteola]QEU26722.1 hypothetical protein FOB45_02640 [Pseudomonas luteola]
MKKAGNKDIKVATAQPITAIKVGADTRVAKLVSVKGAEYAKWFSDNDGSVYTGPLAGSRKRKSV